MSVLRLLAIAFAVFAARPALADIRADVEAVFTQNMERVDLAEAKLVLDHLVDPSVDVAADLTKIDAMVTDLEKMIPPGADAWAKVKLLQRFIYEPGAWNDNRPFSYDMGDPYGQKPENRLLSDYLADRKGN